MPTTGTASGAAGERAGSPLNPTAARRVNPRAGAAVLAARAAGAASRVLKRGGGTALPGLVAERVAPRLLPHLAAQLPCGAVVVTGTNGKTTTSHMLATILAGAGFQPLRNASGSNLARGVATALAAHADWTGRLRAGPRTIGVFETDEAAFARVVPAVGPRLVLVTNLFRDQLDRYGEVDTVAFIWRDALHGLRRRPLSPGGRRRTKDEGRNRIRRSSFVLRRDRRSDDQVTDARAVGESAWPPAATAATATALVLNADDPTVASLGGPLPVAEACALHSMGAGGEGAGGARSLYYGIDDARCGQPELEHAADAKVCPTCGARLEYALCFYGHLGHYRCPNGHRRPAPTVRAVRVRPDGFAGTDLAIEFPAGEVSVRLPVPGLYNVYNALAAAAAAHALGVAPELIQAGLERFTAAFGRLERVEVDGRSVYLVLAKNPVGMNEALRTLFAAGGSKRLLMALNDLDADGRDVSWIWDADFERVSGHAAALTISGRRAADLAVRLKYAGALAALPGGAGAGGTAAADGGVRIEADLARALDAALAAIPPGEALYAVLTYTAMLELRRVLAARGYLRAYWEDE